MAGILMVIDSREEKGLKGEKFISEKLKEFGYKIFYPENKFEISDRIILCNRYKKFYFAQFKFKEPLTKYPNFTGISEKQFLKYKSEQEIYKIKLILLFTDNSGRIYGEWLDNLEKCNPIQLQNFKDKYKMICWDINKLKDYKELL